MKNRGEQGFSLVEIVIVVVVIMVIASLAMPYLQKGIVASENGNVFASLRTIGSTQINFYSQNNRFGRLTEINNIVGGALGSTTGSEIRRGKYVLAMVPDPPTDADLRTGFTIVATRNITGEGTIYQWEITENGLIRQILP
jgi:Tfp pilus assembly protein PilE